jgi:hypothetical protein
MDNHLPYIDNQHSCPSYILDEPMVLLEEATMSLYYVVVETTRNHKGGNHFFTQEWDVEINGLINRKTMKCKWVFKSKPKFALLINIKQGLASTVDYNVTYAPIVKLFIKTIFVIVWTWIFWYDIVWHKDGILTWWPHRKKFCVLTTRIVE